MSRTLVLPTPRPVNPFPDLKTYIPEEYYEPVSKRTTGVNAPGNENV
jgi:hypothetical protein